MAKVRSAERARIAITFGKSLIEQINAICDRDEISFAEAVRGICRQHFDQAKP